jgi:hypothetical protein
VVAVPHVFGLHWEPGQGLGSAAQPTDERKRRSSAPALGWVAGEEVRRCSTTTRFQSRVAALQSARAKRAVPAPLSHQAQPPGQSRPSRVGWRAFLSPESLFSSHNKKKAPKSCDRLRCLLDFCEISVQAHLVFTGTQRGVWLLQWVTW